jgi:hypothetical protein
MRHLNGRDGPHIVFSPSNLLELWVVNQKVFVDEVSPQNYILVEPMYNAERVNSLFA